MRTSVLIPMFNAASSVSRAVQSVLAQTDVDFEVIVVDDGSADSSREVVEGIRDARVRVIAHERNRGISAARNTALAAAQGDFIAFLDADDAWEPGLLTRMHEAASEVDAVICGRTVVLPDGTRRTAHSTRLGEMTGDEAATAMLVGDVSPFPWDKMIRRAAFDGITYPVDIHRFEDHVVGVVALSRVARVRSVPDALVQYYVAAGSLTWGRVPEVAETERALGFAESELGPWLGAEPSRRRAFMVCRTLFLMLTAQSAMRSRDTLAAREVMTRCRALISPTMIATTLARKPVLGAGALLLKAAPDIYRRLFTAYVKRQYALG
ncbi:MAG: glycosyltransferase family 2 protein [Microbacterium sp.]|uniref:glycosyltransferase family 2 protein n=1 Tax=Microbacterium sp. TaxID=51671 RepID=UPI001AD4BCFE|nr:glycosyltransferase family 2 protein [Microbacterium sp.]MBN9178515.1 glycosyltransferase family 2 protein [Microbacterium sp.]